MRVWTRGELLGFAYWLGSLVAKGGFAYEAIAKSEPSLC